MRSLSRKHTAIFLVTIFSIASGCDKIKTAYCTSINPSLQKICETPVQADMTLERGN